MNGFSIEHFDKLFLAILKLKTVDECRLFFEDICTVRELDAISQRLDVARMLKAGENYRNISEHTGASTTTISRVNKCLLYGKGGYETVLSREDDNDES
ncbi:MAG: hypothetical protein IJY01_06505 [Clostridia bacterium]|nr:hypothetical protein [Clostridia bacterium]